MIVLDSSILVAIIKGEQASGDLLELLGAEECAIGTPTLVETRAWCAMNLAGRMSRWLEDFIDGQTVAVVPFSRDMADVASQAFTRFGKGSGHPARLNFGDCMAYAVSAATRVPLLFKGGDFGHTDVLVHSASIYDP
jgi:ribonuclease VapC